MKFYSSLNNHWCQTLNYVISHNTAFEEWLILALNQQLMDRDILGMG